MYRFLDDLYASTMGETNWENIDGWDEGTENLDDWWGLTMSTSMDEERFASTPIDSLIRIKLSENGLQGSLPSSINNVKNLVL